MDKQEKEANHKSFINSSKFGKSTWITLFAFDTNVLNLLETIGIYWESIKKLEKGIISREYSPTQLLHVKQLIYLDSIARLMVIIESTLALCYALSKSYKKVPRVMTFYDMSIIDSAIESIKKRKYNISKILGLPNLKHMNLSRNEIKVMAKVFAQTEETAYKVLERMTDFYERFRIVYGKSKHGLTLLPGGGWNTDQTTPAFENSLLTALDRKEKNNMPPGTLYEKTDDVGIDSSWFNAQGVLKFTAKLESELIGIMSDIREIVKYMTNNHLLFSENCGHDYIPHKDTEEGKAVPVFFVSNLNDEEKKIVENVVAKVAPNMFTPKRYLLFQSQTSDKKAIQSLKEDIITNLWFEPRQQSDN